MTCKCNIALKMLLLLISTAVIIYNVLTANTDIKGVVHPKLFFVHVWVYLKTHILSRVNNVIQSLDNDSFISGTQKTF